MPRHTMPRHAGTHPHPRGRMTPNTPTLFPHSTHPYVHLTPGRAVGPPKHSTVTRGEKVTVTLQGSHRGRCVLLDVSSTSSSPHSFPSLSVLPHLVPLSVSVSSSQGSLISCASRASLSAQQKLGVLLKCVLTFRDVVLYRSLCLLAVTLTPASCKVWVLVLLALLVCLAAADPEAARGGVHFKVRPTRRNPRKSQAKKTRPKPVFRTLRYQPYYESYQAPYDPTGHGDPHFSYFQGS
ncbi:uncharacterized protein LOC123510736 [Portunus trituberculatus]|uniref:uncharacterized protein LOC123510736 n=1 Tax=Portunus trituberculatus TaxID=210409 RepID=UPI001E1CCFA2|nr:uncharacterized protein LOC123510736 [Portunus trituberculatus]